MEDHIKQLKRNKEKRYIKNNSLSFQVLANFHADRWKNLKLDRGEGRIHKHYKCRSKAALVANIVKDLLEMVIDDLIEKGYIFKFPTTSPVIMHIGEVNKKFKRIMPKNVNLFNTDFKFYGLLISYKRGKKQRVITKNIEINKEKYDKIHSKKRSYIDKVEI